MPGALRFANRGASPAASHVCSDAGPGTNSVAVIDLGSLAVMTYIQAGKQPMGLIVMALP